MEKNVTPLKNGLKVANFSSPHDFEFDDGTILKAVSDEQAQKLKVTFNETESKGPRGITDIELSFGLSTDVYLEINEWQKLYNAGVVDVVIIPLPMLTALKTSTVKWTPQMISESPFRCIRIEDRTNKVISSRKFCV
jgi:hypothetical protein